MLGAWCGWASGFDRSTAPARATWFVTWAAAVAVDILLWRGRSRPASRWHLEPLGRPWPRPGHGGPRRVLVGVSPWLALLVVIVAWEVLGLDTGTHQPHLTISALSEAYRALHAALLAVWILVGLGYGVALARRPRPGPSGSVGTSTSGPPTGEAPHAGPPVAGAAMLASSPHAPALLLGNSRAVGVAFWIVVIGAAAALDLVARRSRGRVADGEELLGIVASSRVGNAVAIVGWTYAGWHLFAH